MFVVPEEFRRRPFTRAEALSSGITRGVLQGPQFRRVHEAVYCHVDHEPSFADRVAAARMALPAAALTTGITRLQELGIDHGPRSPLHFVVEGDLHLVVAGVFLHRTVKTPPNDAGGVEPAAGFVAFCFDASLIDAIKVGCEMLRLELMDLELLHQILTEERWRRGAAETAYALPFLTDRCRSMPEAELLVYVEASGLPSPEVNVPVELAPGLVVTPDLWWELFRAAAEYEGSRHQDDRGQYNADIDRYASYRRHDAAYELVTKERLRTPKNVVRRLHSMLAGRGYDGPEPEFGPAWNSLFEPLRVLARSRTTTIGG